MQSANAKQTNANAKREKLNWPGLLTRRALAFRMLGQSTTGHKPVAVVDTPVAGWPGPRRRRGQRRAKSGSIEHGTRG